MRFVITTLILFSATASFADSLQGVITRKSDTCAPVTHYEVRIRKELDNLKLEEVAQASAKEQQALIEILTEQDVAYTLKRFDSQIKQLNTAARTHDYWNVSTDGTLVFETQEASQQAFIALNKAGFSTNMTTQTMTPSACR